MNKTMRKTAALVTSTGLVGALGLTLAAPASAAKGVRAECSRGSLLTLEL